MKARRALLSESERASASRSLCHRIANWLEERTIDARTIGVYLARPPEICLDVLIEELLRRGYQIAAPRVDISRQRMEFWRLESLENLEIGPWQLRQPPISQKMKELPLIVVPGLSFDSAGGRLGSGGGWYDRTLQAHQTVIGACFENQIRARVPTEAHDLRVDFVASDCRWIECSE